MIVTTESGSTYTIIGECWKKNDGMLNRTWRKHCISDEDVAAASSWLDLYDAEQLPLQVGLRMLITAKDEVWLSTPIVSIGETE